MLESGNARQSAVEVRPLTRRDALRKLAMAGAAMPLVAGMSPLVAEAAAAAAPSTGADYANSVTVGDVRITALLDTSLVIPQLESFIPTPKMGWKAVERLFPWQYVDTADSTHLHWPVHGWVIQSPDATVMLDTGLGTHFDTWAPWWNEKDWHKARVLHTGALHNSLRAMGVKPEDVSHVVLSHAHLDHVGGTLTPDGNRPYFPNAKYVMTKTEWDTLNGKLPSAAFELERQILRTLRGKGALTLRTKEIDVAPGIHLIDTPGHTEGHQSVVVTSKGRTAILSCDCMHVPFQVRDTEWSFFDGYGLAGGSGYSTDGQGVKTRQRVLGMAAREGMVFSTTHFWVPFGKVKPISFDKYGPAWTYLPITAGSAGPRARTARLLY